MSIKIEEVVRKKKNTNGNLNEDTGYALTQLRCNRPPTCTSNHTQELAFNWIDEQTIKVMMNTKTQEQVQVGPTYIQALHSFFPKFVSFTHVHFLAYDCVTTGSYF